MTTPRSIGNLVFTAIIAVIGLGFVGALVWIWAASDEGDGGGPRAAEAASSAEKHEVRIWQPRDEILVDSGRLDARGEAIMVSCANCHDTRSPSVANARAEDLDQFHQGMRYQHGQLSCLSCHDAKDYNLLRKSDGTSLRFSESMKLCAQCHGPQFRDYRNGSHGGMTGHWDLSRGGRERNSCINCHDPHHPAYPQVLPVFPPKPVKGETLKHHE